MDMHQLAALGVDTTTALSRFMGQQPLYERFLQKFVTEPTFGQLEEAVKAANWADAEVLAHTLKGVAGNLGFTAIFDACHSFRMSFIANEFDQLPAKFAEIKEEYEKIHSFLASAF